MFALDDIEYEVEVNDQVYDGRYTRLEELVALYECCIERKPTSAHPRSTTYDIRETGSTIEFGIDDDWYATSYSELETTLEGFLADLFVALDAASSRAERECGMKFLRDIETTIPFDDVYERIYD